MKTIPWSADICLPMEVNGKVFLGPLTSPRVVISPFGKYEDFEFDFLRALGLQVETQMCVCVSVCLVCVSVCLVCVSVCLVCVSVCQ